MFRSGRSFDAASTKVNERKIIMKRQVLILFVLAFVTSSVMPIASRACSGLVGDWRFNEGSGNNAFDASGFANHGTLGAAPNNPTWIAGSFGTALHFDGDDFVAIPNSPSLEPTALTVEAKVRSKVPYPSPKINPWGIAYVLAKGAYGCSFASYALYTGASGGLYFYIAGTSSFFLSPDAGRGIWDGEWHHVVGTYDGSAVRLYVDSVEVGTGTPASGGPIYGLGTTNDLFIATFQGTCDLSFVGDIDAVKIWSRSLSPCEIALRSMAD